VAATVDIVMTVYNTADFLEETLQALYAQTFRDYRLIIVDDGSTDGTSHILERAAASDARIVIVTQANAGIVAASNVGLALCDAIYIARQDADDVPDPERLEKQVAYLEAYPDCVATAPAARHIDENGVIRPNYTTNLRDTSLADPYRVPAREPYLMHPFLMVRADAFRRVAGYRPMLGSEDSDLYWRLSEIGRLYNMPIVLGSYRVHSGSISSQSIAHGVRLAFCAQMAALSAQRRRENRPDIVFSDSLMNEVKQAATLSQLAEIGGRYLDTREQEWLAIALSAKIVEICFYRPFEPTVEDARFMRQAFDRYWGLMDVENASVLNESVMTTAVRLALKSGCRRQGFILAGPGMLPKFLGRVVFRAILPESLRKYVKRWVKRSVPA